MIFKRVLWVFAILCVLVLTFVFYSSFVITVKRHHVLTVFEMAQTGNAYFYQSTTESSSLSGKYMTINLTEVIEYFMKFKGGKDIYTRVMHANIFIYSVIGLNNSEIKNQSTAPWSSFGLIAWKHSEVPNTNLSCCFLYENGIVLNSKVVKISTYVKAKVQSFRFECVNPNPSSKPKGVTLIAEHYPCTSDISTYVAPVFPHRQPGNNTLALCAKIAFGNLNADLTVEWIEYNKNMGVDKIAVFVSNLSSTMSRIFQHYQNTGFLDVHPFALPMVDTINRKLGQKTGQGWSDEQVPVYDCMDRLAGYSYVGIVDFDEFIFPLQDKDFKQFVNRLKKTYHDVSLFTFLVDIYVMDWGKMNENEKLLITQFTNRTQTMQDRVKNIVIPDWIETGSVSTHKAVPRKGYKRIWIPKTVAVLKHFRSCRPDWGHRCINRKHFPRFTDDSLVKRLNEMKTDKNISLYDHILKVKKDLKLTS
ncbi:hypothetical protein CHS0354_013701 [Potamilus streckersoni]|uniref:Glycosyltransferase family 92 protein n=1 Tax=Potamilus streckersoni TaxID=2493646 RepID=A0AAE0SYV5_9BIVA|nr:hypothetical protein CHS0354_013701 [Potamilus streckersoni]